MSTYSESIWSTPTPSSLAGYQLVENGKVQEWDLLIPTGGIDPCDWEWADGAVNHRVSELDGYRVYRKMPCPHAGDHDKVPGTNLTYAQMRFEAGEAAKEMGIPNAGAKHEFGTGAHRDKQTGKGEYVCIPPCALRALAKRYEDGAALYGRDNWHKGFPLSSFYNSAMRHMLAIAEGRIDEDHAGAALWNICGLIWTDEAIKSGKVPSTLDDLPYRK